MRSERPVLFFKAHIKDHLASVQDDFDAADEALAAAESEAEEAAAKERT